MGKIKEPDVKPFVDQIHDLFTVIWARKMQSKPGSLRRIRYLGQAESLFKVMELLVGTKQADELFHLTNMATGRKNVHTRTKKSSNQRKPKRAKARRLHNKKRSAR